jgi:hypothetical protein
MDWFELVQHEHGQLVAPAAAVPRVPMLVQHAMSPARVVFLAVLVAFFCALFIGSYIWMRRPGFGQIGGHRPGPAAAGVPATGPPDSEGPDSEGPGEVAQRVGELEVFAVIDRAGDHGDGVAGQRLGQHG